MNYKYFKHKLDNSSQVIFINSITNNLSLEELSGFYFKLIELREEFLTNTFKNNNIDEIEEIRIQLQEVILNIKILIREKKKLDCYNENKEMELLFI